MKAIIIAISGYAKAGKTTLAVGLKSWFGGKIVSIAQPIKEIGRNTIKAMGIDPPTFRKDEIRDLFVDIGKIGRHYDKNFWIKQTVDAIKKLPDNTPVFIDDMRYKNEYFYLKNFANRTNRFFVPIMVIREGIHPANSEESDSIREILEHTIIEVIGNDRTVEDMVSDVIAYLEAHYKIAKADDN